MDELKIIKATYYNPEIGVEQGTDVTAELSAEIVSGRIYYNGRYNDLFPDHFKGKHKRLKIELEYRGQKLSKFYNEDTRINLPYDLGEVDKQSIPAAIKVEGKLKGAVIEDNITMGIGLLEASEIEDSSIKRNKSFLFNPKNNIGKVEIIEGDKIEQHRGKNKTTINKYNKKEGFMNKFWYFVITVLAGLLVGLILYFLLK